MTTLVGKIRLVVLGSAHDLLDKAIDLNSPSALRQYVRDLEDALSKLQNEAAIQAGAVRTLNREIGDLQHNIETETALVQKIMAGSAPNKDQVARIKAQNILNWKNELSDKQGELAGQIQTSQQLDTAVNNLELKHNQMVAQVRKLESTDREAKAKDHAASALEGVGKLTSSGSGISIDGISAKINAHKDVADEKLSRAMGSLDVTQPDSSEVDDFLNSLKPVAQ